MLQDRDQPGNESGKGVISALLKEMDGSRQDVYVIANTNKPVCIDASFNRRFQKWIHIRLPTIDELELLLANKLKKVHNSVFTFELRALAERMSDYSPADIDRVFATITDNKDEALETASHFTKDRNGVYWSCPQSAKGAQAMTYDMVKELRYKYSVVTWQNIEDALEEVPPTNSLDGEDEFIEFGKRNKK